MTEEKHYRRITLGLSDVMKILAQHFSLDIDKTEFLWGGKPHPDGGFPVMMETEIEADRPAQEGE